MLIIIPSVVGKIELGSIVEFINGICLPKIAMISEKEMYEKPIFREPNTVKNKAITSKVKSSFQRFERFAYAISILPVLLVTVFP